MFGQNRAVALLALIAVTAVWGVTFVQVKDAVEIYPLFAFLGVRFLIATAVLAPPAWPRLRGLGAKGTAEAGLVGGLPGAGDALQTARLAPPTRSRAGLVSRE